MVLNLTRGPLIVHAKLCQSTYQFVFEILFGKWAKARPLPMLQYAWQRVHLHCTRVGGVAVNRQACREPGALHSMFLPTRLCRFWLSGIQLCDGNPALNVSREDYRSYCSLQSRISLPYAMKLVGAPFFQSPVANLGTTNSRPIDQNSASQIGIELMCNSVSACGVSFLREDVQRLATCLCMPLSGYENI